MLVLLFASFAIPAIPQHASAQSLGVTGLPLPRFVSLKAKRVNMRIGPGRDYQVQWLYVRKNLPMEIIREFGNWRKVRDPNGVEGWILHSLLSSRRVVIVTPWDMPTPVKYTSENQSIGKNKIPSSPSPLPTVKLYKTASIASNIVAQIEAGSLATVEICANDWCRLNLAKWDRSKITGYMRQSLLWGVYPDENVKN